MPIRIIQNEADKSDRVDWHRAVDTGAGASIEEIF
jgi:hypothetical protein